MSYLVRAIQKIWLALDVIWAFLLPALKTIKTICYFLIKYFTILMLSIILTIYIYHQLSTMLKDLVTGNITILVGDIYELRGLDAILKTNALIENFSLVASIVMVIYLLFELRKRGGKIVSRLADALTGVSIEKSTSNSDEELPNNRPHDRR